MVSHHILEYGYVPFWVLINTLSLGTISIFYFHLKFQDQNDIGRVFGVKPKEMNSYLSVLTIFRNACAHGERLYCFKSIKKNMRPNSITTNPIHKFLGISIDSSGNPICGKNDLFAIVIIFKIILNKESFKVFFHSLNDLLMKLQSQINTIKIDDVLIKMGFPGNWKAIENFNKK